MYNNSKSSAVVDGAMAQSRLVAAPDSLPSTRGHALEPSRNDWWTPAWMRERVLAEWNITLDAAASAESALVSNWFGPTHDDPARRNALELPWDTDGVVFCNPPYSGGMLPRFAAKFAEEAARGVQIVGLIPVSTGSRWWADHVTPYADVEFITGRIKFEGPHSTGGSAGFDSALVKYLATGKGALEDE